MSQELQIHPWKSMHLHGHFIIPLEETQWYTCVTPWSMFEVFRPSTPTFPAAGELGDVFGCFQTSFWVDFSHVDWCLTDILCSCR